MSNVLSEENMEVWKGLKKLTVEYYKILKKRKMLIEDNNTYEM